LVQIRSREDHSRLPGITSGDIGTKVGYNSKENGWLAFDHVRTPRENMLMGFAKVTRDGQFST
jgi:acyl-CoA oxidase